MTSGPGMATKCARTVCNNPGVHQHRDNKQFYCTACARGINAFALSDHNIDLFPSLKEKPVTKHSIVMKIVSETVGTWEPTITGCSCGWLIPPGTTDPDDAIVMHIATRGIGDAPETPTPGLYRHYKGGVYTVISLATIESTMEEAVVYVNPRSGGMWIRTLADFTAIVEHEGVKKRRFVRLG